MKHSLKKSILIISIFAVAMAFLESAVVVYARELYFPDGFNFPFPPISINIMIMELVREGATIIMLLVVAYMIGKNANQRFAWFIMAFGIWDIFYYIFLKMIIAWPGTFGEMDLLFLVPIPWTGPVITPILVSVTLIVLALLILSVEQKNQRYKMSPLSLFVCIGGSVIILLSWTIDHFGLIADPAYKILIEGGNISVPEFNFQSSYDYVMFGIGEFVLCLGIYLMHQRNLKLSSIKI